VLSLRGGAKVEASSADRAVVVLSMPKAGTYLMGRVLALLGVSDTGIHFDEVGYQDNSGRSREVILANYRTFRKAARDSEVVLRIPAGHYCVGHARFSEELERALSQCQTLFLRREVRACVISMMRFCDRPDWCGDRSWKDERDPRRKLLAYLKSDGGHFLEWLSGIALWERSPVVTRFRFEDLVVGGDRAAATVADVAKSVGFHVDLPQARKVIEIALRSNTVTKSSRPSSIAEYWSDGAESEFERLGGHEMNEQIGYPNAWARA
jgi:hypothetical protein